MVIDTTLLKFILTLEYERRNVVLAFESMEFSILLLMNGLRVVLPCKFLLGREMLSTSLYQCSPVVMFNKLHNKLTFNF